MTTKVLTATALALLLGVGAATAQSGGEARTNDRKIEKALDNRELTPIRPIRRVGEDGWPAAKNQPAPTAAPRETTGQAPKETASENSAKQEPAKEVTAKSEPAKQQPAQQDLTKQEMSKQNVAPAPPQQAAPAKTQESAQENVQKKTQDKAQDKSQDKQDFASIRLGTDKNGRVAVNDAQERQISSALRKQRIQTVDAAVTIGVETPASVRLGAVSADIVAVLPQFRGYSYFTTRENIVIVEPDTKKVVALVPVQLTATAARPQPDRGVTRSTERGVTQSTTRTTPKQPRNQPSSTTVTRRETTGSDIPTEEEILASPIVTAPSQTTVTRTYRAPSETVIIEHRRRPRIFGLF